MDDRQRRSRTASDRSGSTEHPDRQRTHRSETARGQDIRGQGSRQQGAKSQSGRSQASRNPNRRPQTGRPANRRPAARRPQTKRRRRRNLGIRICLTVILIIAAIAAVFLWKRYSPSKEKANLDKYYGIEQEGQLAIVVNNEVVEPKGMIADGKAYIQYEIVRDYINSRFYWDPNENILLYTLPKDMVSVEVGSKDYTVSKDKNSEDYVILKTEGSTAYIALDFVQQYTNIDYEVYDNPERVVIVGDWGEHTVAEVKKDTQVRYQGGVKSPILTEIKKGEEVTVIENEENWKKVRTKNGFIGYIKNSALKDAEKKNVTRKFEEQEFTNISKDYTINMAWHNVTNSDANSGVLQKIAESKGLTTIAPTWFHVKDTDGNMDSIASTDYVNYAHQANIEVWATIRDFDGGINSYDESYALLSYTSKRETLINQLVAEALQSNIDGINVDFEKISEECGEHYIQFIRELSVRCRQNGLVLSVDNYVPKGFNMQYDRKEQGIVADYVVIMGYDEHYAGSPEAGSVASYDFVKEGITETLKEVPADKVISGIPFFTRLWEQTPKTEEELASQKGTEEGEYAMKVESKAYGMTEAKEVVSQAGAEITWDDTAKQNYARWESGGVTYEIWLEDEKSLEMKLELMKQNKLAGTAAWALGLEDPNVWQLILKYVN
ncbi:glycosyl hydrolase family 18 protein [Extibacter muris]|uniref:glycosyl hydrolase family 18 protein n=1 Tax=Extibacter muris TaxID=1796622 RepID=UPI001D08E99B|nr:glycosyl hydrolase family 18 protein [Extibacter muris]MCB6201283.1 SH3 domain-containing protein [Extibacter muris]MCQ4664542.1 glycosyl hydrolase family 18 protein [Extibacter muris]MCQ4693817.1 glycosyl hydrolase family 18 protein [Extibacter muris]